MKRLHNSVKQYSTRSIEILATEVIQSSDPRSADPRIIATKYNEIRDLIRRGTFKVVVIEEIPVGVNILTARFVLVIKSSMDGEIKLKARYVAGRHMDIFNGYIVQGAQTLQATSVRLILALNSIFGFKV